MQKASKVRRGSAPGVAVMIRAAILGTGKVGSDLLVKLARSRILVPGPVVGRNPESFGLGLARGLGMETSAGGLDYLAKRPHRFDLVFDASSREEHPRHARILSGLGKTVINLTPADAGPHCIPALDLEALLDRPVVNIGSCAAQAAAPVAFALRQAYGKVEHIEALATLGAGSAGPATLREIRMHARDSEKALHAFSGCASARAALEIDGWDASPHLRIQVVARVPRADADALRETLHPLAARIARYAPGYRVAVSPAIGPHWLEITVQVPGRADSVYPNAGSLDLMNGAALAAAEACATRMVNARGERDYPGAALSQGRPGRPGTGNHRFHPTFWDFARHYGFVPRLSPSLFEQLPSETSFFRFKA